MEGEKVGMGVVVRVTREREKAEVWEGGME